MGFKEYLLEKLGAKVDESNLSPQGEPKLGFYAEWQTGIPADNIMVLSRNADGSPRDTCQTPSSMRMNAKSRIMRQVNNVRNPPKEDEGRDIRDVISDDPFIQEIYGNRHEGRGVAVADSSDPRYQTAQQNAAYLVNLNNPDYDPTGEKAKAKAEAERGKKWGLDD